MKKQGKTETTHLRIHPGQEKDQSISAQTCKNQKYIYIYIYIPLAQIAQSFTHVRQYDQWSLSYRPMLLLTMAPAPSCCGLAKNFLSTRRGSLRTSQFWSLPGIFFLCIKASTSDTECSKYEKQSMIFEAIYRGGERERFQICLGRSKGISSAAKWDPHDMVTCFCSKDLFIPVHNVIIALWWCTLCLVPRFKS